jgi:hypothetical protein
MARQPGPAKPVCNGAGSEIDVMTADAHGDTPQI